MWHDSRRRLLQPAPQLRIAGNGKGATQPGDIESLAWRHQCHAAPCRRIALRGEREMAAPLVEQQIGVYFVGADQQILLFGQRRQALQFFGGIGAPDRVVRIAQQ